MSRQDVEVVRAMLQDWSKNTADGSHIADDVEWVMPHPDLSRSRREEVGPAMREFRAVWQEYQFEVEELRDLGDGRVLGLCVERVKGTGGIEQVAKIGTICTVTDGKVSRFEGFLHREDAFRAAGLSEEPRGRS